MKKKTAVITFFLAWFSSFGVKATSIVNIYTWAEEIPYSIIQEFEKETGIKVNYATFDSNEMMYAKLRASPKNGYDVVEPSNYYIQRLSRQNMLEPLDKTKLPNLKNLDPFFMGPHALMGDYALPFIWGATGLFYNEGYFNKKDVLCAADLTGPAFISQLMLLDDAREIFAIALRMLGYSGNDKDPEHIKQAYLKLKEWLVNVKVFSTDAVLSILIDEDANAGIVWNADLYKAHQENAKLKFVYPADGFTIWVDDLAILKNAPHRENAYQFINFLLRPDIAAKISLEINYATANLAAKRLLPAEVRNDLVLYPDQEQLKKGELQADIGDAAFAVLEKYWEQLKMGA